MTKLFRLFAACVILALLTTPLSAAEPVTLKFATFEPAQAFLAGTVFKSWIDKINEAGKGVLEIKIYAGGTLGRDPKKQLKLVTDGIADMSFIPNPYHPGRFPYDLVANIPFLADTALNASLALNSLYEKGMLPGYNDVIVLALMGQSQYGIHSTFPVRTPSDLKGKKIRTAGKIQHALAQACGAAPVGVPIPGTAEAISRGVVQGTISEWVSLETWRIKDVAKYHCMVSFGTNPISILMNKKKYDSLSEEAKAILDKYKGVPFSEHVANSWQGFADDVLKKIKKDPDHKVYFPTDAEMKQWQTVFAPVISTWAKGDPKKAEVLKIYKAEAKGK